MRWPLRQFGAIATLAALEGIRQPIALLVATTGIVLIALLPILVTHTLGETERLARDSGLALHFVCGLVLGSYAACSSLTHEIRRGTVSSVLSKPVSRELFLLAKFSGISAVMVLFSAGAAMGVLLSTRMSRPVYSVDWWAGVPLLTAPVLAYAAAGIWNYSTRRPFVSAAFVLLVLGLAVAFVGAGFLDAEGNAVRFGAAYSWKILPASVLITLAILVLTGIAVSLAIRLDTVPTLSICSVVFVIGLMSDYLFGRHAGSNTVSAFLYRLVPNWQHFWVVDALSGEGSVPWSYVARAALYAVCYLAGVLGLGLLAFRHMEIRS
ncbi:MAG: hypothetical protein V1873_00455 [Verrucomicrobiota bacterium]